jgi:predicted DNA-binding transcriptional regulator AlpA
MDLHSIIYSDEAPKIQLVVNAKDLRDFAESIMAWGMKTIKERDEPTYYTREEMMELLHVSDPTIRDYRRKGLIPEPVTVGGRVLYDKAKVREALTKNRVGRWIYKK